MIVCSETRPETVAIEDPVRLILLLGICFKLSLYACQGLCQMPPKVMCLYEWKRPGYPLQGF